VTDSIAPILDAPAPPAPASPDRLRTEGRLPARRHLRGKRAAVVVFSYYSEDPRPRRAAEALVKEGMSVDVVCLRASRGEARRETVNGVAVLRLPLQRRRGGAAGYLWQYAAFILGALAVLAARSLTRRYDLVHVHNMPDALVLSALVPKALGARVILDLHDPMPELMMTIFGFDQESRWVRALKRLERWSIRQVDLVLTVNLACQRLFASRSCPPEKIRVVMNAPDEEVFGPPWAGPARAEGGDGGRPFAIMYHGSLVERNGLALAVEAVARLRASGAPVELKIYGRANEFLTRIMESVQARGLAEAIHYLGPRPLEQIVTAIEACDAGVIPNSRNIFAELNTPTRIFEYLAVGRPVIAPRAPGILDYFGEDDLTFFELGDAEDLARKIESVRSDPRRAAAVVRRGQAVYREHTWRQEREVLLDLVDELMREGVK
jgi:glycosyltransferase involved in cell wall biosynthesis